VLLPTRTTSSMQAVSSASNSSTLCIHPSTWRRLSKTLRTGNMLWPSSAVVDPLVSHLCTLDTTKLWDTNFTAPIHPATTLHGTHTPLVKTVSLRLAHLKMSIKRTVPSMKLCSWLSSYLPNLWITRNQLRISLKLELSRGLPMEKSFNAMCMGTN
jgi:hypothetical protein